MYHTLMHHTCTIQQMDKKTRCYSFSHNHGSVEHGGIFENFERSLLEDPFFISMIMGGRVNENGGMKQIQFIFHVPKMVTQIGDSILQWQSLFKEFLGP